MDSTILDYVCGNNPRQVQLCKHKLGAYCIYEEACIFKRERIISNKSIMSEETEKTVKQKNKFDKQIKYGRFLIEIINSMENVAVCDNNCEMAEKIQKESLTKLEYLLKIIKKNDNK